MIYFLSLKIYIVQLWLILFIRLLPTIGDVTDAGNSSNNSLQFTCARVEQLLYGYNLLPGIGVKYQKYTIKINICRNTFLNWAFRLMAKSEGYDLLNQTFIVKWNLYNLKTRKTTIIHYPCIHVNYTYTQNTTYAIVKN